MNQALNYQENTPLVKKFEYKGFNLLVAWSFTINYIIGAGILAIPYAFWEAGIILSISLLTFYSLLMILTLLWVSQICAESAAVFRAAKGSHNTIQHQSQIEAEDANGARTVLEFLDSGTPCNEEMDFLTPAEVEDREQPDRLFTLNELLYIWTPGVRAGSTTIKPFKIAYEIAIMVMMFLSTFSYVTVWSNAMTEKFPIFKWDHQHGCPNAPSDKDSYFHDTCWWIYRFWAVIFSSVVTTLTMLDFTEMMAFQVFMTAMRFLLFIMLILTSAWGIHADPIQGHSQLADTWKPAPMFKPGGFSSLVSTSFFAQLVVFGVPDILHPVRNKRSATKLWPLAIGATTGIYVIVGTIAAIYWGNYIQNPINLAYANWVGRNSSAACNKNAPIYFVEYFVTLFPAFDVVSIFPLLATSLANTLKPLLAGCGIRGKLSYVGSRLLATVPACLCGIFYNDLSVLVNQTIYPALIIGVVTPIALQFYSRKTLFSKYGHTASKYYPAMLGGNIGIGFYGLIGFLTLVVVLSNTICNAEKKGHKSTFCAKAFPAITSLSFPKGMACE